MSDLASAIRVPAKARNVSLALAAMMALLISLPLYSQVNTGRVSGNLTDQTGGAIVGATVNVIDVAQGTARALKTDASGAYAAPNLLPGVYTVHAEAQGFQSVDRQNVQVGVGSDVRVDIILQPGATTQTVTVTESIPVVDTTNAQTGGVLNNDLITNLPTIGRNFHWQQNLVPGAVQSTSDGTLNTGINGTPTHGSNTLLDGVYSQTYFTTESTFGGGGEAGTTTILPLDAIQEVDLVVNPKAEYGWVPGMTASVGLKSGTNNIHGDAYAFGRDTALDASNPFSTTGRTPLTFEQFGGTLGGRIIKNKLFYFAGYEGFRESATSIVSIPAPTTADTGSTSLSIPDAIADMNAKGFNGMLNTLSLNIAGCDPSKITSGMITGAAVVAAGACNANHFGAPGLWANPDLGYVPDDGRSDTGLFKLDYHVNDHHTLNGSLALGNYFETAAGTSVASIIQNYWEEVLGVHAVTGRIAEIWSPNSAWLNEARWGVDHSYRPVGDAECSPNGNLNNPVGVGASTGGYGGPTSYPLQYGLLSGAPGCGLPAIILSSPVSAELGFSNARADNETDEQGSDVVSFTHGSHQFKFGVDIRAIDFSGAKVLSSLKGTLDFGQSGAAAFSGATSLEDFLAGTASEELIAAGSNVRSITQQFVALFAQDDWRIKPRLTLNLGFRAEVITSPASNTDNLGNFDPTSPTGIVAVRVPDRTLFEPEPRFGLAWDVTGKGTTTFRAGVGVLYDLQMLMSEISGGGSDNLDSAPTGETLYAANGSPVTAPGNGKSATIELLPTSNAAGVVTSSPIIWASQMTLFPSSVFSSASCGNGLNGNPVPCTMPGDSNLHEYSYIFWNVNFEHAFTNNLSLDVGYVGSRTTGLNQILNLNQVAPNLLYTSAKQELLNAPYETQFPWFSSINIQGNGSSDTYRSLQITLNQRVSHGLTFTSAYTYQGNYQTQGILNIHVPVMGTNGPYGGNNNPPQTLSFTTTYQVPGIKSRGQMLEGWAVSANVLLVSSLGVSPSDTTDDLTGAGASEPWSMYGPAKPFNQIFGRAGTIPCYGVTGVTTSGFKRSPCIQVPAGPAATPWANLPAACIAGATKEASYTPALAGTTSNGSSLEQLALIGCYDVNGSAIVPPAQGTYGTMLPNSIRGAGLGLLDAAITKEWTIKERLRTQFRAEFYNLLNRTQYTAASANLGSPSQFGESKSTPDAGNGDPIQSRGGPRSIEFALKLIF